MDQWTRVRPALQDALCVRAEEMREQRSRAIDAKCDAEEKRLRGTLADLQSSIQRRLDELERSDTVEQLRLFDTDERRQFDADVRALRDRVQRIGADADKEVEILRRRYEMRDVKWFPVAVEFLVPPRREVVAARRRVVEQHEDWLILTDAEAPWLSLPVLKRALPNGLDPTPPEVRAEHKARWYGGADVSSGSTR